nr:MAG TPA: protein of unknown function (DUF4376) [Caudoviricetes sp.]
MICVVDKNNKIINIINADSPTRENERIYYPWCSLWEKYTDVEPLWYAKQRKTAEFKARRDSQEVAPVEYNGNSYDYDSKARERINAAIIALDQQSADADIAWTTADDNDVTVTAADLRAVIAAVAVRSNALHVKYRKAKAQIEAAGSAEEVNAVCME